MARLHNRRKIWIFFVAFCDLSGMEDRGTSKLYRLLIAATFYESKAAIEEALKVFISI